MKILIALEELALAALAGYGFVMLGYQWWLLGLLFLVADVSMIGYLLSPRVGAATYNIAHHRGIAIVMWGVGIALAQPLVQATACVLFFHSSIDRVLGYGLKYSDSFSHTHLGTIGPRAGRDDDRGLSSPD